MRRPNVPIRDRSSPPPSHRWAHLPLWPVVLVGLVGCGSGSFPSGAQEVACDTPIGLEPGLLDLVPGEETRVVASRYGCEGQRFSWSVSDSSVASIRPLDDSAAIVHAVAAGRARVTADAPGASFGGAARIQVHDLPTSPGIVYSARSEVVTDAPPGVQAPKRVRVVVTMTNTGADSASVGVRGCPVRPQAFADSLRAAPPIWSPWTDRGLTCAQESRVVELAPGESSEFHDGADAANILGDRHPPGRYFLRARFLANGDTLELPAGDALLDYALEGLRFEGVSQVRPGSPDTLQTRVIVRNPSDRPIQIEFGACALELAAHEGEDRSKPPVWGPVLPDPDAIAGEPVACPLYLRVAVLQPGDSVAPREFEATLPTPLILGDSLPPADYSLTAHVDINRTTVRVPAGVVELHR